MRIGIPKEIKTNESRVGLTPDSVRELFEHGHEIFVETNAGVEIGCLDTDYQAAGAKILPDAKAVFDTAEMIIKVKEPQPDECKMLSEGQILFTYLHLAADKLQADLLKESKCTAIAYETVTDNFGGLPLLAPMSEVAGRFSIQAGARCLERPQGGSGILLGGVPGVDKGKVVIIGGGVVGTNAAVMALGKGAHVTMLDRSSRRLSELSLEFRDTLDTIYASAANIERYVLDADLVVGAVLVPGDSAPKLVKRDWLSKMRPGSVLVDVAIDQGGCFETSKPTTHQDPTYIIDGVIHYCVANMPGAVPRTSAFALNNVTMPHVLSIANLGLSNALNRDSHLVNGLNVCEGAITHPAVAHALKMDYVAPDKIFNLKVESV
ncbi:MAG: alanine dehydrogenase [Gammaproteobacteria bacterium]|nr:alanine dehydrogenase [Gammaproteobacteria bacterium]